ncbi:hypothetical protein [Urbifossiella limnaea]|uniref:Type-1 restriction enzyme EcoKI specificity protein n=1 Tax=Urbifossiella limnaea TaxID=2528023 RepID=A0A517XNB7_9BACT|nr:hypothetical protein [Urbifossiella limnaea]QDU18987.1 Type-1 restriction enzyme EcoKI specificity protein [Urbifossiella limnaea]
MTDAEDLPDGWAVATLGEIGFGKSQPIDPAKEPEVLFELWSVPSFASGEPEARYGREIESGKQRVQPGDVLLCKINPRINRVWIVGPYRGNPQIASTEWMVIRTQHLDSRFLVHQLRECSFRERLLENVSGVGGSLMRARPEGVRELEAMIPPLAEQRRIVAKVEELTARSRAARVALVEVPTLLEQFRQSVLASAFRGDLTTDWRAKHPHTEPASEFLARIRTERRKQWEAKYPKKKYVEPDPVDDADLPELPEGWCWATIEELNDPCRPISYGILKPGDYESNGIAMLRITDMVSGEINDERVHRVSQELSDQYSRTLLCGGELLVSLVGTIGVVASVPNSCRGFNIHRNLGLIAVLSHASCDWIKYYLRSPNGRKQISECTTGGNQPLFNLGDLRLVAVPVAPQVEQALIIERISHELNVTKATDLILREISTGLGQLDQSILAKAFRGELVPQDPDDEPATLLLERLRTSQAEASMNGTGKRTRRKQSTQE